MPIGLLLALLAAVCSGTGSVLQAVAVERTGAAGGTTRQLPAVLRHPSYLLGLLMDLVGFACAALALQRLPLFAVQATVATSVGVTTLIAVALGARLPRIGWLALAGAGLGLVLLGVSADPKPAEVGDGAWRWLLLLGLAGSAIAGWAGSRPALIRVRTPLLALGAGLGYATVAVSARTLDGADEWYHWFGDPGKVALAGGGILGALLFAAALQHGTVTQVAAVAFTTQTCVPAAIGLALLGDHVRPGHVLVALAGFALAVGAGRADPPGTGGGTGGAISAPDARDELPIPAREST